MTAARPATVAADIEREGQGSDCEGLVELNHVLISAHLVVCLELYVTEIKVLVHCQNGLQYLFDVDTRTAIIQIDPQTDARTSFRSQTCSFRKIVNAVCVARLNSRMICIFTYILTRLQRVVAQSLARNTLFR
jgi:hypothetical protein